MPQEVLDRLTRCSQGPNNLSRTQITAEFCRRVNWRNAKGELSVSSAAVALKRLESLGLLKLPPKAKRRESASQRGLTDDGLDLPPVPKLSGNSARIAGLRVKLIADADDPDHGLWNRLIVREHPQGRQPLVGAQLRYIIECDAGIIGALGFGPAAYHLECRDQWVGWSTAAREANRSKLIGLSRFLIRCGLRVPNLASQCYGLILGRIAQDWLERYGIEVVMVETYVDREHHSGRSLAGANWVRIGQSKGRGRNDHCGRGGVSRKDVWMYELKRNAREQLQAETLPKLAPRSVFAPALREHWAQEELAGLDLGDQRLSARAVRMLSNREATPGESFNRSFGSKAEAKGAYQLLANRRAEISLQSLLKPHYCQSGRRMAAESVVILAQDTTTLSYNGLRQTTGLGPLGKDVGLGFFLHSLQAFRLDGIPLGLAWSESWARPQASDTTQRNDQSIDEKESGRWVRAFQATAQLARQMPQTQIIVAGDRESDIYELYDQLAAAPSNLKLLVRVQHDRNLVDGTTLRQTLAAQAQGGTMNVEVPRRQNRPSYTATLELRWCQIEIKPPAVAAKKTWSSLKINVVWAREINPPSGQQPIDWMLATSWPITSLKMACRSVQWYGLRWGIECWHKTLKEVCRSETRQLKSIQALERALAFDIMVASRTQLLVRLSKENPTLPAENFYSADELEVLEVKNRETEKYPPGKRTILEANILTAMLIGFWARPSDGHPGAMLLSKGLRQLELLVWYKKQTAAQLTHPPKRRKPT